MKKHLVLSCLTVIFLSGILFYWGCKKSTSTAEESSSVVETKPAKGILRFPIGSPTSKIMGTVEITADGFLKFPDVKVLAQYRQYLVGLTHAQIQSYLRSEGFNSYGALLYSGIIDRKNITEEQASDYLINADLLVQIDKIIYRPKQASACTVVKWDFVLAMDETHLSPSTLASIKTGTYDASHMNKFATNPSTELPETVDEFMRVTPTGYDETSSPCPPRGESLRRPMFGTGGWQPGSCTLEPANNWLDQNGDGIADPTYNKCRKRREYVFWIGTGWDTDCFIASGCAW